MPDLALEFETQLAAAMPTMIAVIGGIMGIAFLLGVARFMVHRIRDAMYTKSNS